MVHNHYLEEAKKKTQEKDRNSKSSVMPSARLQNTANGSKLKPRSTNVETRSLPTSKSSCVTIKVVPIAEHFRNSEVPTSDMIVMTSRIELKSLFGPLFDKYFNEENLVVSKSSAVNTADESDTHQQQPYSTSSTSILATTLTTDGNFDL
ncbi:hypothetical protein Tco_1195343 [Tanacetum coccineum]